MSITSPQTPILNQMNRVLCTSSYKITKGERLGYMTSVLYLAPFTLSGINVCPHAKLETCAAACLNTSGRGSINRTQESRIARTKWFHSDRESFVEAMVKNLEANIRRAHRLGFTPCIRPNGTSDLPWENITHKGKRIMEIFSNVQWYDYTKVPLRMKKFLNGDMPDNYHLTFSRSGDNDRAVNEVMQLQGNVSVVFRGGLPDTWNGVRVIDGDEHDLRFTDPKGVIVGLSAKGKARKMDTKFVVNN